MLYRYSQQAAEKFLRDEIFFRLIAMRDRDLFGQYQLTENGIHSVKLCSSMKAVDSNFDSIRSNHSCHHLSQDLKCPLYSSTLHRRYPSRSTRNCPRDSYRLSFPVVIITNEPLSFGWRFDIEPDALHPY